MKNVNKFCISLFGIIAVMAIIVGAFASCGDGSGGPNPAPIDLSSGKSWTAVAEEGASLPVSDIKFNGEEGQFSYVWFLNLYDSGSEPAWYTASTQQFTIKYPALSPSDLKKASDLVPQYKGTFTGSLYIIDIFAQYDGYSPENEIMWINNKGDGVVMLIYADGSGTLNGSYEYEYDQGMCLFPLDLNLVKGWNTAICKVTGEWSNHDRKVTITSGKPDNSYKWTFVTDY